MAAGKTEKKFGEHPAHLHMVISISASRGQFLHLGKAKEATADFLNTLKRANNGILAFCTSEPPKNGRKAAESWARPR